MNPGQIKLILRKVNSKLRRERVSYVSFREKIINFMKTRKLKYEILDLDKGTVYKYKRSDTLFILGSGASINNVPSWQWEMIAKHDSLGFNWFIYHPFIPTFYYVEYDRSPFFREFQKESIKRRFYDYKNTVFFVHSRAKKRGVHPRFMPDYFPDTPKCCYYRYPRLIKKHPSQPLTAEDFKKGFQVRGSLNLMLYIAYKMKYNHIVLMGVDLKHHIYFYDDYSKYPEAKWMETYNYNWADIDTRKKVFYGGLRLNEKGEIYDPRKNRRTFLEIILAINNFVFKPQGICLYTGSKESLLINYLPYYYAFERENTSVV